MVWPPDKATTSVRVNFLVARELRMVVVLLVGAGRLASVTSLVAKLTLSLLPRGMSYDGPPDFKSL